MFIVTPAAAARVVRENPRRTWCYLGTDVAARERLRSTCGADVPIGADLTAVALRLKQPFLDWIAQIGRRQRRPVRWWASAMASKSPLQTELFLLVCYGEILAAWATGGSPAQVIVIEDAWLFAASRAWLRTNRRVQFAGSRGELQAAAGMRLRWLAWLRTLTFAANAAWAVARARAAMSHRVPTEGRHHALIFTWIEARAFPPDGTFRDPYTGRLASILAGHGMPVARLTPLAVPRALWASMRASDERFVVVPAFARIGDVLRAACARFRIDAETVNRQFLRRDHGPLLERERLVENASASFRQHLLWHAATRRIAARMTGSPVTVIYPFENQPHEKLLCLAWREAAPDATLIGYVTAGIPSLLLSFFLGTREAEFQPLPDTIVTNGPASRDLLAASGYPADRLVDGGAFRFEHLARMVFGDASSFAAARGAPRLLVPLPTVARYARELLESLSAAFREPVIDPTSQRPIECIVTFHVDLPREAVVNADVRLPSSILLSSQTMGELLDGAALCVFIPPTSSWREALIAGVPVLRYRPDTLDIDPVDALAGVELPECSRLTLRDAILTALRSPVVPTPAERARLLGRLYSPVQESVWLSLAGLSAVEEPATMKDLNEY